MIISGHEGAVQGLTFSNMKQGLGELNFVDTTFISTGFDKQINIWSLNNLRKQKQNDIEEMKGVSAVNVPYKPKAQYLSKH